jgi:hypothetical protein
MRAGYIRSFVVDAARNGWWLVISLVGIVGDTQTVIGDYGVPRVVWWVISVAGISIAFYKAYADVCAERDEIRRQAALGGQKMISMEEGARIEGSSFSNFSIRVGADTPIGGSRRRFRVRHPRRRAQQEDLVARGRTLATELVEYATDRYVTRPKPGFPPHNETASERQDRLDRESSALDEHARETARTYHTRFVGNVSAWIDEAGGAGYDVGSYFSNPNWHSLNGADPIDDTGRALQVLVERTARDTGRRWFR